MIRRFVFLFVCLFSLSIQSQEVVLSFKNEDLSRRITKDSYTLINNETKDLALVIIRDNIVRKKNFIVKGIV